MVLATSVNVSRRLSVRTDMQFDGKFPLLLEKDIAMRLHPSHSSVVTIQLPLLERDGRCGCDPAESYQML